MLLGENHADADKDATTLRVKRWGNRRIGRCGGGGCNGGGGGGGFIGGKGGVNGSENGGGGWSYVDKNFVIWHSITTGEHAGPGEVFIIPDINSSKNQSQCKCHDFDSLCLTLSEDVADVNCYCASGHLVDVNIPCNEGKNKAKQKESCVNPLLFRNSYNFPHNSCYWMHRPYGNYWTFMHVPL